MMVLPSSDMVARLAGRMTSSFFVDIADIVYRFEGTPDDYGQPTYTEIIKEVQCSFTDKPSRETWANFADIENIEAEVRFMGAKPGKGDRVTLKSRFENETYQEQQYAPQTYEIIAIRDRDAFGYVCALKAVQL